MFRDRGRATIYGMAGFYLLYLAYQMFGARTDNNGGDYWMMMIFSVLFVVLGVGILLFSISILRKCTKEQREILEGKKEQQSGEVEQSEPEQSAQEEQKDGQKPEE